MFCHMMIVVRIVEIAGGGPDFLIKIYFFACAYGGIAFVEVAAIGVECYGALWIVLCEAFGFGESKRYFG